MPIAGVQMPVVTVTPITVVALTPISAEQPYPVATPLATPPYLAYPYPQATFNTTEETIIAAKATGAAEMGLTLTARPTSSPEPTGIHDVAGLMGLPGMGGVLAVENSWLGIVNGKEVRIWAGAYADTTQGVLYVMFQLRDHGFRRPYLTPAEAGSIRIVSERNNRLELISASGTKFYFDVPGLQFVSFFDDIVATITPEPEATPTSVLLTAYP